jgi:hypothetical protein
MRILTALMLCSLVIFAGGWTRGTAVAPPKCSSAGSAGVETGWLPGHQVVSVSAPAQKTRSWRVTYTRWCGPASAVVRQYAVSYQIRGGRCSLNGMRNYVVQVGLIAYPPAAPAEYVGLFIGYSGARHSGEFRVRGTETGMVNARIQLPHNRRLDVLGGTITIDRSMRDGTFALRLHDRTRVTGSWTCG